MRVCLALRPLTSFARENKESALRAIFPNRNTLIQLVTRGVYSLWGYYMLPAILPSLTICLSRTVHAFTPRPQKTLHGFQHGYFYTQ